MAEVNDTQVPGFSKQLYPWAGVSSVGEALSHPRIRRSTCGPGALEYGQGLGVSCSGTVLPFLLGPVPTQSAVLAAASGAARKCASKGTAGSGVVVCTWRRVFLALECWHLIYVLGHGMFGSKEKPSQGAHMCTL